MNDITIRIADESLAGRLLEIYAPYVRDTAITFEYAVPSPEDFAGRIRRTLSRYPYLFAAHGEEILGYAYAGPLKGRAAYDWSTETSVYVRSDARRRGVGRSLYSVLEMLLSEQGVRNMYACIAASDSDTERLGGDSLRFHERMGFREAGRFRKCGYKFSAWYDIVWMEKTIRVHDEDAPVFLAFPKIRGRAEAICAEYSRKLSCFPMQHA